MKNSLIQPCLILFSLLIASGLSAQKENVLLHTIDQMNRTVEALSSHAGEEKHSVLEPMYEYMQLIPQSHLKTDGTAIYPRIKKMANEKYILFCQGGQVASRIYYYISDDLKTWSEGKLLFEPYDVKTSEGDDVRRFSTADAVVLSNGDILVACSYRASKGYKNNVDCGLVTKRSKNNGLSWSDEEVIFKGANWEPFLLQLPDGRIQCYFTDCLPKDRNSGTSVITSTDNGSTWHSHMRVCRQYKYENNGVPIYTDQMPSFRLLNDGKTLLGFLEARVEPDGPQGKSKYMMSLVRNEGFDWKPLGETGVGPTDRETNLFEGCAGYVANFPSGETLISSNINRLFSLKIGNSEGRIFNGASWEEDWFQPFAGLGFWGSLEVIDSHRVIGAMHCNEGIQIGVFYLNHRIDASRAKIKIDGQTSDWNGDQALFIGSDSDIQSIFRASYNNEYLYLLAECKDNSLSENSKIEMYVHHATSKEDEKGTTILSEIGPLQKLSCSTIDNNGNRTSIAGTKGTCKKAKTTNGEIGYIAEIAIPIKSLGEIKTGDSVSFNAIVKGKDLNDTFTFATIDSPASWTKITLK